MITHQARQSEPSAGRVAVVEKDSNAAVNVTIPETGCHR
jgi:hypothetical protein